MTPIRILWHVGLTEDSAGRIDDTQGFWALLREYGSTWVARASVDLRFVPKTTSHLMYPYLSLVNGVLLAEDVLACEAEGFDAVMLAPAIDPALDECRSIVDIPVVGSVESAMALSQFVGRKVGVLTVHPGYTTTISGNLTRYGLRDRLLGVQPVRHWDMPYADVNSLLGGNPDAYVTGFRNAVQDLVSDGADVVVGACQWFGALQWRAKYDAEADLGVPFIDCAGAGLAMAEQLAMLRGAVGFQKSRVKGSVFAPPEAEWVARAVTIRRE